MFGVVCVDRSRVDSWWYDHTACRVAVRIMWGIALDAVWMPRWGVITGDVRMLHMMWDIASDAGWMLRWCVVTADVTTRYPDAEDDGSAVWWPESASSALSASHVLLLLLLMMMMMMMTMMMMMMMVMVNYGNAGVGGHDDDKV